MNYIEILEKDGYCYSFAIGCSLNDSSSKKVKITEDFNYEDFYRLSGAYYINSDGFLVKDEQKALLLFNELQKDQLRVQRESECFSVINRGKLWYDNLTTSQLTELQNWYQEWLDVTETFIIPKTPVWINKTLQ